jgi:hypothetical protein
MDLGAASKCEGFCCWAGKSEDRAHYYRQVCAVLALGETIHYQRLVKSHPLDFLKGKNQY